MHEGGLVASRPRSSGPTSPTRCPRSLTGWSARGP